MKLLFNYGIKNRGTTTRRGWYHRGVGITYAKKEDMRMVLVDLLFVDIGIGWLNKTTKGGGE